MNRVDQSLPLVGSLTPVEFRDRLNSGLGLKIGPFLAHVSVSVPGLADPLLALYRDYPLVECDTVFSFHAKLKSVSGLWRRSRVRFSVDGVSPHEDMPASQALPVLEWGINLVIALRSHCFLMLHAAALEYKSEGLLMPAAPGQGKSTLCAGLMLRGWRLFSDEFGLLRPGTTDLVSVPRPLALKNESINVIRDFDPDAHIGPTTPNTRKGDVAHLRPSAASVRQSDTRAPVRWIVFPAWRPGEPCTFTEISKAEGFMQLASNAFNYELLGEAGFETVRAVIREARCFHFEYSDLNEATAAMTDFVERNAR